MSKNFRFGFLLPSAFCFLPLFILLSGCQVVGAIANAIPQTQAAAYPGLTGQSVGVMVWADRGVTIDWPGLRLDLASVVQDSLHKSTAKELKGASWPVQPASIARYQRDHPEIDAMSIADVATKLGVSRLIYIEVESFSTRSEAAPQMYRGGATVTLKVVEVSGGKGTIGYEASGIRSFFPKKGPAEGLLNANDMVIYRGTLGSMAEQIVNRLATHEVDPTGG